MPGHACTVGLPRGARLTVSIVNLLNEKQKVRDANGHTPLIYQRDYLDPLGRTVTVSLRKIVGPRRDAKFG